MYYVNNPGHEMLNRLGGMGVGQKVIWPLILKAPMYLVVKLRHPYYVRSDENNVLLATPLRKGKFMQQSLL